jgi:hypothetical protein
MAFSGSGSRTKVALLLSLVRASVAELVLRTLAQDDERASPFAYPRRPLRTSVAAI